MDPRIQNRWLAALLAWVLAVTLVGGAFALWQYAHHEPLRWMLLRDVALITAPLALVNAWRDRGKR